MAFSEQHYISRDGLKLYYRQYGRAEQVIVCLPGLTRNSKDFHSLAEHLGEDWRVLCPDFRGRGQSQWDPKPSHYNVGYYVRDTWRLLDELEVKQCVIIGTSLGGLVAMNMAGQQPSRLRGIVLNDIGPEIPPEAVGRILQYAGRTPAANSWQAAAEQVKANYELAFPSMPEGFWEDYVHLSWHETDNGRVEPDMDRAIGDSLRKAHSAAGVLRRMRKWGLLRKIGGVSIDTWDAFRCVAMPCLVLRGEVSDVLTPEIVQKMKQIKPGLISVTVPDRGHAPLLNELEALAAIDEFLRKL